MFENYYEFQEKKLLLFDSVILEIVEILNIFNIYLNIYLNIIKSFHSPYGLTW